MTQSILLESLIVFLLIVINGVFSMSELALVSSKKNRLSEQAEHGNKGAKIALKLSEEPSRFLSTVQIGITLIGILSGALGGATLAEQIGIWVEKVPVLKPYSEAIGVFIVVVLITYISLVIGELVPKQLALSRTESIAIRLAPVMYIISKATTPLVSLLSGTTKLVLKLFRWDESVEPPVTEDDVRSLITQGTEYGVFEETEEEIVSHVFRLGDRKLSAIMTPRTQIVSLDLDEPIHDQLLELIGSGFSIFPVIQGSADDVVGIVQVKDLFRLSVEGKLFDITSILGEAFFIPESMTTLEALQEMRKNGVKIAMVMDEFSGVSGMVSLYDIVEAIIGDIDLPKSIEEPEVVTRDDGTMLMDGLLPVDKLKEALSLESLPGEGKGYYETLGGLLMYIMGEVPKVGDFSEWENIRFEIVDMDGRRVDKVLATSHPKQEKNSSKND